MDGQRVGSVFVVRKNDTIAKLRLLIVDPKARGLGLGGRFVDECLRFAKSVGYKRMTLWTQSSLTAARRIYAKAGFECVAKEPHHSFGVDLVGETWERDL
jgi:GNAT superfamily N-acetyltransferase